MKGWDGLKVNDLIKNLNSIYSFDTSQDALNIENIVKLNNKTEMLVNKTIKLFKKTMKEYGIDINNQQKDFAYKISKLIFGEIINKKVNLVPAKCGFGKSVLIKCAMKTLADNLITEFSTHHNEGAIIITDKITKLEEFKIFIDGTIENKKGHKAYLLKYTERLPYETEEEYYLNIYKQRKEQKNCPILLLSSQRLSILNEKIEKYETWNNENDKKEYKRAVKIIDEKPEIFDIVDIDNNFMASIIDSIENIKIKDIEKDNINKSYLRMEINEINSMIIKLSNSMCERQLDIYYPEKGSTLTKNDIKFFQLCNTYLSEYTNNKINYLKKLLVDEGGLYSNNIDQKGKNKRYFKTLGLKKIESEVKTIIFDATSYYDMSYFNYNRYQFININDERKFDNLFIHNIPINMAKWAITKDGCKKLITCANYLKGSFGNREDIFLVTYKSIKDILDKQLGNELNLVKYEGNIPSFGMTKGKNNWNECTTMIHLGFNRMREIEYIARYLSLMLEEDVKEFFEQMQNLKKKEKMLDKLKLERGSFKSDSLQKYLILSLLVDFEQEIFRTKIRDFNNTTTPVHIYVFNMYYDMITRVERRFGIEIIQEEKPIEFIESEIIDRRTKDGKETNPQKIINWINNTWNGEKIKTKDMLNEIGISQRQFDKSKENNNDLKGLLSKYMIKRGIYKKVS